MPPRTIPAAVPVLALFAAFGVSGLAQMPARPSTLPAMAPTSVTPAPAMTAPLVATPAVTHGHHAYVTFRNGQLEVRADNSSLNVILREIARLTGMTISGGVADQRVFGNYGPADAGAVIATLLDGTGVNILLKENGADAPAELILTPRVGNVSLPSPDASSFDAEERAEQLPPPAPAQPASYPAPAATSLPVTTTTTTTTAAPFTGPPPANPPFNNVNGSPSNTSPTASTLPVTHSVPIDTLPQPSTTPSVSGIVDAPNPPPAGSTANPATSVQTVVTSPNGTTTTTTMTAPNGAKTPAEVYQELLALQQAQQKAAAGSSNSSTTSTPTPSSTGSTTPQP
jgi:hypothetical protein